MLRILWNFMANLYLKKVIMSKLNKLLTKPLGIMMVKVENFHIIV